MFRLVTLIGWALGASMACTAGVDMAADETDARAQDMAAIEPPWSFVAARACDALGPLSHARGIYLP